MQGDHSYGTLCRALTRHSLCSHLQVFLLHVVMFPCCRELLGSPSTAAPCGSVMLWVLPGCIVHDSSSSTSIVSTPDAGHTSHHDGARQSVS